MQQQDLRVWEIKNWAGFIVTIKTWIYGRRRFKGDIK